MLTNRQNLEVQPGMACQNLSIARKGDLTMLFRHDNYPGSLISKLKTLIRRDRQETVVHEPNVEKEYKYKDLSNIPLLQLQQLQRRALNKLLDIEDGTDGVMQFIDFILYAKWLNKRWGIAGRFLTYELIVENDAVEFIIGLMRQAKNLSITHHRWRAETQQYHDCNMNYDEFVDECNFISNQARLNSWLNME